MTDSCSGYCGYESRLVDRDVIVLIQFPFSSAVFFCSSTCCMKAVLVQQSVVNSQLTVVTSTRLSSFSGSSPLCAMLK